MCYLPAGITLAVAQRHRTADDTSNPALSWGNSKEGKETKVPRETAAGVKFRRGTEFSPDRNRAASGGEGPEEEGEESKMFNVCVSFPQKECDRHWSCWV